MRRKCLTALTALLCLAGIATADEPELRFTGRVLQKPKNVAVPGVLVAIVEAKDDGRPTDEILATAHADAEGHFNVYSITLTRKPVSLAVYAVRESAASGGNRRYNGYNIQSKRELLGFLPHPSLTKPNTIVIEPRKLGRGGDDD